MTVQLDHDDETHDSFASSAVASHHSEESNHHSRAELKEKKVNHDSQRRAASPVLRHLATRHVTEADYEEQEEVREECEQEEPSDSFALDLPLETEKCRFETVYILSLFDLSYPLRGHTQHQSNQKKRDHREES